MTTIDLNLTSMILSDIGLYPVDAFDD